MSVYVLKQYCLVDQFKSPTTVGIYIDLEYAKSEFTRVTGSMHNYYLDEYDDNWTDLEGLEPVMCLMSYSPGY